MVRQQRRRGARIATPRHPGDGAARRIVMTALAVGGAILLAGCQSPAERAAEAMAMGQQLASAGQYGPAQQQFDIAVAARDDLPELWMARARNQVALNDYAGAFGSFRNALDQDRTNREALDAVAQLSLATGRLDDARDYATQILSLDPNNMNALLVDATVAFRRGRLDYSEKQIAKIRTLEPNNEAGRVLASQFAQRRGRLDEAQSLIEPIFVAGEGGRELRRQLQSLYERSGNARGLLAIAQRNAAEQPRDPATQLALAKQLLLGGQDRAAAQALDQIHRAAPGDAQRDMTVAMLADADVSGASLVAMLGTLSPPDPELALAAAQYALARGDYASAERLLAPTARDRQVGPDTADEQGAYALALAGLGRSDEAARRAKTALQFDGGQTEALMARALVELAARNVDGALRDARVVAAQSADYAPGAALLSRVFNVAGDKLLADKALFDAINADRDDPIALRQLTTMLVQRGRAADAADYARGFTVRNPASVAGWSIRQPLCRQTRDANCVARATAMSARLHGQSAALPATPEDEQLAERDYSDGGDTK
ncbi:hypothetical protein ASG67_02535 [Sphingomonas sp. Leaf339]|nr:hypothetical protein ASG67_02535 [Sphingomonas sp. Leaf339]